MKATYFAVAALLALAPASVSAAGFVNGGFEEGSANGWAQGNAYRVNIYNPQLDPGDFSAGNSRSAVISAGTVDARVGAALGSTVYSGNYSYRVEDTSTGGYASLLEQRVNNYTDANIFFAWKSVLQGAHGVNDAGTMIITLKDMTSGTEIIRREYNAASSGGGVDSRFSSLGGYFYTPEWQIEQLAIGDSLMGHDFLLSVIAADCELSGHLGYVYLDGFGAVTPPPVDTGAVPEPATWAMMIGGFALVGSTMRRRRTAISFA